MIPGLQLQEVVRGLCHWSSYHPQWKINFDCYALRTPEGVVFIDPLQPVPEVLGPLEQLGPPLGIVLTNANHDRDAEWFRKRYKIEIYAHETAQPDCETRIDVLVLDKEKLPGGLKAVRVPGSGPGEVALHTRRAGGILFLGDTLLNLPGKGLSLLPAPYLEDRKLARQSLRQLLDLPFKTMTFAHGEPLVDAARQKLSRFLRITKKTHA